jgi:TonB family protein
MDDASERHAQRIEAARIAAARGDRPEAIDALNAAITAGEEHLPAGHPAIGAALNELGRQYIRRADFASAEPVLHRLLKITRAKGDRHPDVATVLAGLAVARRGLGDLATAEKVYRHALKIREEVLAPDHMAIVVTLEQLGETCEARGNLGEALVHLQRALPRRERALGADHASVERLRARIAELERRATTPIASDLEFLVAPIAPAAAAPAVPAGTPPDAVTTDAGIPAAAPSRRRRTTRYAVAAAAVAALAITGFSFAAPARHDGERASAGGGADAGTSAAADSMNERAPAAHGGPTAGAVAHGDSSPAQSASGAAIAPAPAPVASAGEAPARASSAPVALPNLRRIAVPKVAMPSVDSLMKPTETLARAADAASLGATGSLRASPYDDEATVRPPVLVGVAPVPRYPDELRAHPIEGEVIVQFKVSEKGRVDPASMQVIQSPHALLTEAVRSILPRFRFDPARSGTPDAKPQAAWVQFRSTFTAGK